MVQIAQATPGGASSVTVQLPTGGARVNVPVVPGEHILIPGLDFSASQITQQGGGLLITLPDGSTIFLEGFVAAAASGNPPVLDIPGVASVPAADILAAASGAPSDIQPAAGPGGGAPGGGGAAHGGGAGFDQFAPGSIGDGLNPQDLLNPLGFSRPALEPIPNSFPGTPGEELLAASVPTLSIDDVTVRECCITNVGEVPSVNVVGGAIFITGHDSDEHNNADYQTAGLDYLAFGHAATGGEIAARGSVNIVYLAVNESDAAELVAAGWTNVTVITNPADYANAFTAGADLIMVGSGGYTEAHDALSALSSEFTAFINAGGALFIHTDQGFGQTWYDFVPDFGATNAAIGNAGIFTPTGAGTSIGLTEAIVDADITHSFYTDVNTGIFTVFETTAPNNEGVPEGQVVAFGARGISIGEGGFEGTCVADFTVTLSEPSATDVVVHYQTADGTALANQDYVETSGDLVIPAGQLEGHILVPLIGDDVSEGTEQFTLNLSAPVNATIADGLGLGTILDGDTTISIANASFDAEGYGGCVIEGEKAHFTLTADNDTNGVVSVQLHLADGTAAGGDLAVAPTDGTVDFENTVIVDALGNPIATVDGLGNFTLSWDTASSLTLEFYVQTLDDTKHEALHEDFFVSIVGGEGVTTGCDLNVARESSIAIGCIEDNDTDQPVSITDLTSAAYGGDAVVDEDHLADGSSPDALALTQTGTFTISAPDGVASLTIDGHEVFPGGVFTPTSFTTGLGNTLSVTGFDSGTGEITYTYELIDNTLTHGPADDGEDSVFENFAVHLADTDGSFADDTLSVQIIDDTPSISAQGELPGLSVDESFLTAATNGINGSTPNVSLTTDTVSFAGAFTSAYGADGAGTTTYALSINGGDGTDSGLVDSQTGDAVLLVLNGDVIEGHVDTTGGALAFTISVDGEGDVTLTQDRSMLEGSGENGDISEGISLGSNLVLLTATITDADGDTDTASIDLGTQVSFLDDGPVAHLAINSQEGIPAILVVDETDGVVAAGETDPVGGNLGVATISAATLLSDTSVFGADGAAASGAKVYSLSLLSSASTGLTDTATGGAVVLVNNAGVIEGHAGSAIGATVFTLAIDGSTGDTTLTQFRAVVHGTPELGDTSEAVTLNSNLVGVTLTVKDADGDTSSATANLNGVVQFLDDGPTAAVALNGSPKLIVDETDGVAAADETDPVGGNLGVATISAATLLSDTSVFGSDGAAASGAKVYALSLLSAGPTGLTDTATGGAVVLVNNAGVIEGHAGSAIGATVFTLAIDTGTGVTTLTQFRAVVHGTPELGDTSEAVTLASNLVGVTLTVKDGDGDTSSATANLNGVVQFLDDGPIANEADKSVVPADAKSNVLLILDVSGSMGNDSGLTGLSRLDVVKAAANELLDQYDNRGDVMVRIVTFSSSGAEVGSVWMTADAAKAAIAALTAGGSTNYDAALLTAMGAFTDSGKLTGPGTQNVSYFLSDGDPTANQDWPQVPGTLTTDGIQASEQAVWESFLTTNGIVSFALGIPDVGTPANLDPIAFDPAPGTQAADTPIIVTDLNQLAATLVTTIPPVPGNILTDSLGSTFGADGGHVQSITVDGRTYTFDPAANGGLGTITGSGGVDHLISYDSATKTLTVDTDPSATGGELAMVMTTGAYTFTPPAGFAGETIGFVLIDNDGDTAGNNLVLAPSGGSDNPPIVRDDHVFTNISGSGAAIAIPDSALLYNDTDANGQAITITGVGTVVDGTSVGHAASTVTFTDNDSDGGSFVYTGSTSSPAASDTATVTITRAGGSTINGDGFGDILIGGTGGDTLIGHEGHDVLIGGAGADDFRWNTTADFGDIITDFTPGSDQFVFDVGGSGSQIPVGNNNTTVTYAEGANAAALGMNVAGNEVIVQFNEILDGGDAGTDTNAEVQTAINGYTNITTAAVFVFDVGSKAEVWYDPNPSVAGGAVKVAEVTNITTIDATTLAATDVQFV